MRSTLASLGVVQALCLRENILSAIRLRRFILGMTIPYFLQEFSLQGCKCQYPTVRIAQFFAAMPRLQEGCCTKKCCLAIKLATGQDIVSPVAWTQQKSSTCQKALGGRPGH